MLPLGALICDVKQHNENFLNTSTTTFIIIVYGLIAIVDIHHLAEKFDKDNVTKAWVHLHFIDYSTGEDEEREERTFNVYKVT